MMKVRSKKVTYRQRKARATSSLRDARGAELKRVGVKESIRIGLRRGIPCVIRREPRGSLQKIRRGTRVRNKERTDQGEKSHPLLRDFLYPRFKGNPCPSALFHRNSIFWLSNFHEQDQIHLSLHLPSFLPSFYLSCFNFFFSLFLLEQSR